MKPRVILLAWLSALSLLSGCAAVGPNYQPPAPATVGAPAQWASPRTGPATAPVLDSHAAWWAALGDTTLDALVEETFRTSPTLEAAVARLAQARAGRAQTLSYGYPGVTGQSGQSRAVATNAGEVLEQAVTALGASWELDLYGAQRRGVEGANARLQAQAASLADVRVSLAADVADAYVNYRVCQANLALNRSDVVSREATATLTSASVEVGFTAPYQGARALASVAEAQTQRSATQAQCDQLENQLSRLTGLARSDLVARLGTAGLSGLRVPGDFNIAIPAHVLQQRPDLRAAERSLAAASADIGLAVADRYPRLTLTGNFGYTVAANSSGTLSFGTWAFGPSLSLPVLDGGRRAAAVDAATARYEEALANYKVKTRLAVQEVEDALTRYAAAHQRELTALQSAAQYQRFFAAVEARYREGANNLLELEDARRAMLSSQQVLLGVQHARLQAWVALHRATGSAASYVPRQSGSSA